MQLTTFGYVRVPDNGGSRTLDQWNAALLEYAHHEGLTLGGVFVDVGAAASLDAPDRPGFAALLGTLMAYDSVGVLVGSRAHFSDEPSQQKDIMARIAATGAHLFVMAPRPHNGGRACTRTGQRWRPDTAGCPKSGCLAERR